MMQIFQMFPYVLNGALIGVKSGHILFGGSEDIDRHFQLFKKFINFYFSIFFMLILGILGYHRILTFSIPRM